MTALEILRQQVADKRAQLDAMITSCRSSAGVTRDMTPDEMAKFDKLMSDVQALMERVKALEDMEGSEADTEEETNSDRSRNPVRGQSPRLRGIGIAPAVHTREHRWSITRALRLSLERRTYDGIEGEIHQELLRRRTSLESPQGILIPLGNEPEFRTQIFGRGERRDLTTTTGAGAVFTVAELPFIELLRNKLVIKELGATFLTGLNGKIAIPRQNAASTAYWVAEGVPVAASNPTLDQVPLTDKTLGAIVNMSRKFLYQTSVDAEQFVKNDLAKVLAIELDRAAINGSGSGAVPLGILQNSSIQTLSAGIQGGTNGAVPTFAQMVAMESQVAINNADQGMLKYLTTPALRGTLKTTPKSATVGYPVFLSEEGELNGYPLMVSNNVPSSTTKGSATNCSSIIFANWEDLIVAQWGGIDVLVNPYTGQAAGAVSISMMMEADIAVRHPESFAAITDAKVA